MSTAKTLRGALALCATTLLLAAAPAPAAEAPPAPALSLGSLATPTNFVPGDAAGEYTYDVRITNLGAGATDGSDIVITDTLPAGLEVKSVSMVLAIDDNGNNKQFGTLGDGFCELGEAGDSETVTCTLSESIPGTFEPALLAPAEERRVEIEVFTPEAVGEGKTLTNHVEVEGGGAPAASLETDNATATFDAEDNPIHAGPGITYFRSSLLGADGQPVGQAGSHPFQFVSTSFAANTRPAPAGATAEFVPAGGDVKDIRVSLPPGLAGNPTAVERCNAQDFATLHAGPVGSASYNACPESSVVGLVLVQQIEGVAGTIAVPLYNLVAPPGMPAQFGFQILGLPFFINTELRPDEGYKVVGALRNLSQSKRLTASTVLMWGTPADERHDALRGECLSSLEYFPISLGDCAAGIAPKPFLRLPTSCASPLETLLRVSNWTTFAFATKTESALAPSGCNQLEFEPGLEARPTTDATDSPSGLHADVHIPQNEDPEGLGTADLREAVVTLPEGIAINPSSANGLAACSPGQVGLTSPTGVAPPTFSAAAADCPGAARIGSVEVDTPLVDHPLEGGVYVATPHENPFDSLLALYIAVEDARTGIVLKLAGEVEADPVSGRLKTTFAEAPQQPFEDFKLDFFGGPGAALRTPATCGTYSTTSSMTPWSAPESGPPARPSDTYAMARAPGGGACATSKGALPHAPSFETGTLAPIAGTYSPLVLHLRRQDGSQELSSLAVTTPPGLTGRLAGIPYCPPEALAAAAARPGRAEQASPSCPAASRVGSATVGAGAGPAPYFTGGTAYLAGPYRGAPLSLAFVTPATAGPYDLGTVVVRAALHINQETAQITAVSDPIPSILQGIPLDVRQIDVALDRPGFILNPTSCDPMTVAGAATSVLGQVAPLAWPFQVGECGRLGFKPKLALRLKGKTKRNGYPALTATVRMPAGGANIARTSVALPRSEFLAQNHIRTICTRVQFAAEQCPRGSVYGKVKVFAPLFLDQPLTGPVYLRSSSNPLPDLVAAVQGPPWLPVKVAVVGRIDSVRGGIRTTFDSFPDVPFTKAVLSMQGGKKGLLVNSRNICRFPGRAVAEFDGQNGKTADSRPLLKAKCKKKARKGRRNGKGGSK